MFTVICCSIHPDQAEALRRNVAQTIGCPHEFVVHDNRTAGWGLGRVYNHYAAEAHHDLLCFVHEDVRFDTPSWGGVIAAKLREADCGAVGFAGSTLKLARLTSWHHAIGDLRANYVQHLRGGRKRHRHAVNPEGGDFSPVVTLDGLCLFVRRNVWASSRFDEECFPGFHLYDMDFTTALFAAGRRNWVCHTVLVEHFSEGSYTPAWLAALRSYHVKWESHFPLSVMPLTPRALTDADRRAEAGFLKMLCQKGIFAECSLRTLARYIGRYPLHAKSWGLLPKYLKYRIKHLRR